MSRRRLEQRACSECGAERWVQPFECDQCGLRVELPVEEAKGVYTLDPAGWITVNERAREVPWVMDTGEPYTTVLPRLYCSWACLERETPTLRARSELTQEERAR